VQVTVSTLVEADVDGVMRYEPKPVASLRGRIRVAEAAKSICRLEMAEGK
jgi:hypothetical protein